ncbi:MAG: SAM-dependent DNA methyltransferase, partial [Candidatus Electrothrix sp. GM3_4]|nr:SAM-dependent DNA methyltransferase [Candidatus Electrothrix sp. GM3_4]
QLNFQVSEERLKKLAGVTAFTKLGQDQQEAIIKALQSLDQDHLYRNREVFIKAMKAAFKVAGLTVKPAMLKIIWQALSQHDEQAEVVLMKNGSPEPDSQRRDYENIPLTEDIDEYFQREVVPHLPNAWIDHSKTKVGYEIPFNRHFYSYVPPRPLEEIDADLDKVSGEIMGLLQEVCS